MQKGRVPEDGLGRDGASLMKGLHDEVDEEMAGRAFS
jgi:hypothetical protein